MATYKYAAYLEKNDSDAFDKTYNPGADTPHSGIYRCMGCNREIVSEGGKPSHRKTTINTHTLKAPSAGG